MKPDFALSLSFDGIALFQRAKTMGGPSDGWYRLGEVALSAPDLAGALAALRQTLPDATVDGPEVKLILPEEQVRFMTIPAPEPSDDITASVEKALDGTTPYRVSELSYDYAISGGNVHIAAVTRDTLSEAESFAIEHNFLPLAFVTIPPKGDAFPREPFFGPTRKALTTLTPGVSVFGDDLPVAVLGPAPEPDAPAAPATPDAAATEHSAPVDDMPAPEAEKPAGASSAPQDDSLDAATPDTPDDLMPTSEDAEADAGPDAAPGTDDAAPSSEPEPADKVDGQRATAQGTKPAAPQPADKKAADKKAAGKKAAGAPQDEQEVAGEDPEQTAPAAPAKDPTPSGQADKTDAPSARPRSLPSPAAVPPNVKPVSSAVEPDTAQGFSSIRARRDDTVSAATSAPLTAEKGAPRPVPDQQRRISLTEQEALAARATASLTDRPRPEPIGAPGAPKAVKPKPSAPDAAGPRDTGPGNSGSEETEQPASSSGQRAASFATTAMARASTGLGKGIGFVSRRTAKKTTETVPEGRPSQAATAAQKPRFRLRGKGAASALAAGNMMDESERMTVFGARGNQRVGGKPRFLGLILTTILLFFLLAVAAWASLFLEGGIANLLGRTETPMVASATPEIRQSEIDEQPDQPVIANEIPETALILPVPETARDDDINVASLSPGVPALSEELIEGRVDGLSVPFEAEALTPEQAEARYAATGIWQRAPVPPDEPQQGVLADLYVASIDPGVSQGDAIAIPSLRENLTDLPPSEQRNPLPFDSGLTFDDDGLIEPSPEGVVAPDGYMLFRGAPDVKPPPRPRETLGDLAPAEPTGADTGADTGAETGPTVVDPSLVAFSPRPRPGNLVEQNERANLGGISLSELAAKRPKVRPDISEEKATGEADETATAAAIAESPKPNARPRGFASLVERARDTEDADVVRTAAVAPRTVQPKIPSSTSVAKQATVKNAINLRKVNLIGVYGKPSARRALVRLSNGRYKKVKVGDRIDGGRVAAIGEDRLSYTKSGRQVVLQMPRG